MAGALLWQRLPLPGRAVGDRADIGAHGGAGSALALTKSEIDSNRASLAPPFTASDSVSHGRLEMPVTPPLTQPPCKPCRGHCRGGHEGGTGSSTGHGAPGTALGGRRARQQPP